MSHLDAWRVSNSWKQHGQHFTVEVKHWIAPGGATHDDGRNRWNVYAYIRYGHPLFAGFQGGNLWQEAATSLPLHGGPTFLEWSYGSDGKPICIKVGSNYQHLYEDILSFADSRVDAAQVFSDARRLYEHLQNNFSGEA